LGSEITREGEEIAPERSVGEKLLRVAKGAEAKLAERQSLSLESWVGLVADACSPTAFCEKAVRKMEICCFLLPNKLPLRAESYE
jgi:hypothetical protein